MQTFESSFSRLPVEPLTIGRYVLHREIARGGMATIHIARLIGHEGFSRIVAAKRLHAELAQDPEFVEMFLTEARIASRLQHRNIVPVLDVVTTDDEIVLVQELIHGAPLHWLMHRTRNEGVRVPIDIAVAIACHLLSGLHAAHELTDELGTRFNVVHRDVSPQNVMVATDGTARLLDFGIAKTALAANTTRAGVYKGKLSYSAPEQLRGAATRQSDLYSLSVVLWELLVGRRMHVAQADTELIMKILNCEAPLILASVGDTTSMDRATWDQLAALEPIVQRGLALSAEDRWETAVQMEEALLQVVAPASSSTIAAWLKHAAKELLDKQDRLISADETSWRRLAQPVPSSGPAIGHSPRPSPRVSALELPLPAPALPPQPQPQSMFPELRGHGLVIGVLGTLIALAILGIVAVVRTQAHVDTRAPLMQTSESRPVIITPAPARSEITASATTTPRQPTVSPPRPTVPTPRPVEPRPTIARTQPPPARRPAPAVRPPPSRPAVVREREPEQRAAPKSSSPEAPSCDPPYYFRGSKKLFKPACL
jgi:serine/threonine protein kinase